jgi:adenylyltransferase/sulfurtransferase
MIMLNDDDLERYARQVIMPDIDEQGQQKLAAAKVLVIGAGGLGAPGHPISGGGGYWPYHHS